MSTPGSKKQSPAVYRRRRIVLLVAVLVIVAAVWLAIAQPWRGWSFGVEPSSSPSSTPTSTGATELPVPTDETPTPGATTPAPTEGETPAPGATPCVGTDIQVVALTDQGEYASGQNPQLGIQLTNSGATDCTLNVGTTTQIFTVSSGNDVWWRSTDCQTEPSDMVVLLTAGQTVTSAAPIAWDRTRSAVGTCQDTNRPLAPGGGASFHLRVAIGGIESAESKQFLLY